MLREVEISPGSTRLPVGAPGFQPCLWASSVRITSTAAHLFYAKVLYTCVLSAFSVVFTDLVPSCPN